LAQHLSISIFLKMIALLSTFFWIFHVNKNANIDVLGAYFFDLSIINYLTIVAGSGFAPASRLIVPELTSLKQSYLIRPVYRIMLKRMILASIVSIIVLFVVMKIIGSESIYSITILSLAIPFQSVLLLNHNILRTIAQNKLSEYFRVLHIPIFLMLITIIGWKIISLGLVLQVSFVMASFMGCVGSILLIYKHLKNNTELASEDFDELKSKVVITSKSFYKINLLNGLNEGFATILLGVFTNNTLIGQYAVVKKILQLPRFITQTLNIYITPLISKWYHSAQYDLLNIDFHGNS